MTMTTAARNAMLGGWPGTHVSLHTGYSTTGANEVSGGAPAYARKAITYAAAAAEARAASATPTFDVPASTIRFVGHWDAVTAGNFLGMSPLGGDEKEFAVDIATENRVKLTAHGWSAGQKVVFIGDTPPTGLTEGTIYFVAGTVNTNDFQVSATNGGAAITMTGEPGAKCVISAIVEEVYGAQGTYLLNADTIRLNA